MGFPLFFLLGLPLIVLGSKAEKGVALLYGIGGAEQSLSALVDV